MVLISPFIKLFYGIIQTSVFGKRELSHGVPKTDKAWPARTRHSIGELFSSSAVNLFCVVRDSTAILHYHRMEIPALNWECFQTVPEKIKSI